MGRAAAALATVAALIAAGIVYGYGMLAGHVLDLRRTYLICGFTPRQDHSYDSSLFPLSSVCTRSDGSSFDLVPAFVNPTVLGLLVLAAVFAVLTGLAHHRSRATD